MEAGDRVCVSEEEGLDGIGDQIKIRSFALLSICLSHFISLLSLSLSRSLSLIDLRLFSPLARGWPAH